MGKKKHSDKEVREAILRVLIKSKRVKKECCQSKPRCKKCPVLAMRKIKSIMDSVDDTVVNSTASYRESADGKKTLNRKTIQDSKIP